MPDELSELTRVWREAVEATHDFLSADDVAYYAEQVRTTYLPALTVDVVARGDEVLGFAGVDGDRLEMLFVGDRARGTGVGTMLLDHARRNRERLLVDVNEQNPSAHAFYLRRGFRQVGRSETDGDGRPFPILHLEWMRDAGVVLTTDRLRIAPLEVAQAAEFVAYRTIPEVARWQSWDVDYSLDDALAYLGPMPRASLPASGEWQQLGITDADGALLGDVAVHRLADQPATFEVGVTLAPSAQGRGVAAEALGAVLRELFAVGGAHRVIAFSDARNEPVARLLGRLGFRQEARQVDGDWFKGEWTTLDQWALLEREWRGRV
nr:GNAT family N-acetyltransferase [Diaminobutyricimonas aerilata]